MAIDGKATVPLREEMGEILLGAEALREKNRRDIIVDKALQVHIGRPSRFDAARPAVYMSRRGKGVEHPCIVRRNSPEAVCRPARFKITLGW